MPRSLPERYLYLCLFLLAGVLAYASEWGPYYLAALFPSEMRVVGPISQFSIPCTDAPRGQSVCRAAYRVPTSVLKGWESRGALGLGVILYTTEAVCVETGKSVPLHSTADASGQGTDYLNSYQVYYYYDKSCPGDLVIKAWAPPTYRRYGHVGAPMVVGSPDRVRQVKVLIEFFLGGVLQIIVAIFLALVFFDRQLVIIAQERDSLAAPEKYAAFWIVYMLLVSNVFNMLMPVSIGQYVGNKAQHIVAWNAFPGILLYQLTLGNESRGWLPRLPGLLIARVRWVQLSPLNMISLLVVCLPSYNAALAPMIATVAGVALALGLYRRDLLLAGFALCELLDAAKLFMVPHMPMYYMTMIFVFLCFAQAFYRRVQASARVFETLKWTQRIVESYHEGGKIAQLLRAFAEQFGIRAIAISQRGKEGGSTLEAQIRGPTGWSVLTDERSTPLATLEREVQVEKYVRASLGKFGSCLNHGARLSFMRLEQDGAEIANLLIADYPSDLMNHEVERLRFNTSKALLLPFLSRAVAQRVASEALARFLPDGVAEKLIEGKSIREDETGYLFMVDIKGSTRIARRFGNDHWAEFTAALSKDITAVARRYGYTLQFVVWDAFYFTKPGMQSAEALAETVTFAKELHEIFSVACTRAFGEFAVRQGPSARFCLTWGDTTRDVRGGHKSDWTIVGKTMAAVCKLEQACKDQEGWLFASATALVDPTRPWVMLRRVVNATDEGIYKNVEPCQNGQAGQPQLPELEAFLARPRKSAA
ncbi:MAG: hypothetical protein HY074_08225 [Deltaproteobacteria bacterium]|nr:hypothetical protein [Deltaproteobacteria bacterium]